VVNGVATLSEIERFWHLGNVMDANEALDIQEEANRKAAEAAGKDGSG
jgi:hypothetical protein